jgi:uncharacterized protein (TIGR02246 family)
VTDTFEDERAIGRLLAEYCFLIDDGDFIDLVGRFTEDAEFVFAGTVTSGRDALLRFFEATGKPARRGKHITANTVVDVDGDTATACSDYVFFARSGSGLVPLLAGRYRDELRRETGRWLLRRREAIMMSPD